jgi:hypothetical protein
MADVRGSAHELIALRADTPSMRLLADRSAEVLAGMSDALDGLVLLTADRTRSTARRSGLYRLHVPDLLPP